MAAYKWYDYLSPAALVAKSGHAKEVLGAAGTVAGGYVGSHAGPVGTGTGSTVGYQLGSTLGSSIDDYFSPPQTTAGKNNMAKGSGQPSGVESANRYSPQQMQLQNTAIQQLLAQMQNPQGQYEGFDPIAEEARNDYYSNIVPGLAQRFTNMGTQGSGAYRNAQSSAAKQFETGLAALKAQYGNQNKSLQQSQLANLLGSSPYENFYRQGDNQPPTGYQTARQAIDSLPQILQLWADYKNSSSPKSDLLGNAGNIGFKTPTSTDMLLNNNPNQKFQLGGV